jgi:hypothetical protein
MVDRNTSFSASPYEFEVGACKGKVKVSVGQPYTSAYRAGFSLSPADARRLARWLNHFADESDKSE